MAVCKKCGLSFSTRVMIDGKQRNLQHRKFCLTCSPFNLHNTKNLTSIAKIPEPCIYCGKVNSRKGNRCWACRVKIQRERNFSKLYDAIGGMSCWVCGYNRCRQGLEFHHVYPDQKIMQLSAREMQMKWQKIWTEVQKCILVCACCHREIHAGLIGQNKVIKLFEDKWLQLPTVP